MIKLIGLIEYRVKKLAIWIVNCGNIFETTLAS